VKVPLKNLGQGVNRDQIGEELALGVWTNSYNVRVRNGSAERFNGIKAIFANTFTPYFIDLYSSLNRYGVYAGLSAVAAHDGTSESLITGVWPTGTVDDRITGGLFQGNYVLNNGAGDPVYWNGNTASACAALPGWPSGWKAKSVRVFRDAIFALNLYRSGQWEPHSYAFSDLAEAGSMPSSWSASDTNSAGDGFVVSSGKIVDGIAHNDAFYIFKDTSVWEIRWIGGIFVYSRTKVGGSGMLAANCGVSTPVGMVVLTPGDVVVHNGMQEQSIANGQVRDWIFKTMNRERWGRCFVTMNPSKFEVLICFPSLGKEACNQAAVWNWVEKTWSIRKLPDATCGGYGQVPASISTDTWDNQTGRWYEQNDRAWLEGQYAENDSRLVLGTLTSIGLFDQGNTDFGAVLTNRFECTGVHLDEPQRFKLLKGLYLTLDATDDTELFIQVGSSKLPDQYPNWKNPKPFIKGTSQKVDVFTSGRYLAWRIGSSGRSGWRVRSAALDVELQGFF
jgi:hypothetical protein